MSTKFLAQIINPVLPPQIGSGGSSQGGIVIGQFISNIISAFLIVAFLTTLIYLLTGAFHWITSSGDKGNLENARNKIIHALVGLIVVASVWAIATLVGQFVGLDIQRLPIPSIGSSANNVIVGPGDCSYAKNGQFACYSLTECVQCVNSTTLFNQDRANCAGMECGL